MVFPSIAGFLDRILQKSDSSRLTKIIHYTHTLYTSSYTEVIMELLKYSFGNLTRNTLILKKCCRELFGHLEVVNLFTIKWHVLNHIFGNVSKVSNLQCLDTPPYEHFSFTAKKSIRMTSIRKICTVNEVVNDMNAVYHL